MRRDAVRMPCTAAAVIPSVTAWRICSLEHKVLAVEIVEDELQHRVRRRARTWLPVATWLLVGAIGRRRRVRRCGRRIVLIAVGRLETVGAVSDAFPSHPDTQVMRHGSVNIPSVRLGSVDRSGGRVAAQRGGV